MTFKLTEEQTMIQSMVRDLAREEFAPRAMELDKTKEFPAENLHTAYRRQGVFGAPEFVDLVHRVDRRDCSRMRGATLLEERRERSRDAVAVQSQFCR